MLIVDGYEDVQSIVFLYGDLVMCHKGQLMEIQGRKFSPVEQPPEIISRASIYYAVCKKIRQRFCCCKVRTYFKKQTR